VLESERDRLGYESVEHFQVHEPGPFEYLVVETGKARCRGVGGGLEGLVDLLLGDFGEGSADVWEGFKHVSNERSRNGCDRQEPVLHEQGCLVLGGGGNGAVRVDESWCAGLPNTSVPVVECPDFFRRGFSCDLQGV